MTNPTASLRSDYCPICPGIGVRQLSESVSDFIGIRNYESGVLVADATGNLVAYRRDKSTKAALVELASGAVLKTLDFVPTAMRHEPRLHAVGGYRSGQGVSLFDDTSVTPLITLGIDGVASNFVEFDPRGTQLAWGNADGTVTVCNLEEIRDRLSRSGLQW